ncbi:MAG: metalloregulator ArsR/SmtB family transcription factor [Deferrisomatales bacterium]|nr:metalloregulator ArsR/SmtB family transcription factor [Deferrisomatales bacterium]
MEGCTERTVHPGQVEAARSALAAAPVAALAETFRTLGDPTRVGILLALADRELCGCDLSELFGVTPSAISHQLRLLKAHRLVRARREGKLVYYGLDDEHVHTLFAEGRKHVEERW